MLCINGIFVFVLHSSSCFFSFLGGGGGGYLTLYGMGVESTPPASYFADNFETAERIRMKFSDF